MKEFIFYCVVFVVGCLTVAVPYIPEDLKKEAGVK